MQPTNHITDLGRTQIALRRLYERAIQCALEAEAEESKKEEASCGQQQTSITTEAPEDGRRFLHSV